MADLFPRWIFFILSLLGLRQWLARIMPQSLVLAVGAGIGLFIAFIDPVQHKQDGENTTHKDTQPDSGILQDVASTVTSQVIANVVLG